MKYAGFNDLQDLKRQFDSDCDNVMDDEILIACYNNEGWEGDAFVLIQRDGKLYTVEGSHCSCYGLEGQWDMIETTKDLLKKREFYRGKCKELTDFLTEFLK